MRVETVRPGRLAGTRNCVSELLTAGADYRVDELAMGIFVSTLHQLGQVLMPVRRLVVRAAKIERTDCVVDRLDDEHRVEARTDGLESIAQSRRLGGGLEFSVASGDVQARAPEPMRCSRRCRRGDDDDLCRPGFGYFLEET